MISNVPGGRWVMLALAILVAVLLTALWSERIPLSADRAGADSNGPVRGKSRLREMDTKSTASRNRPADPALVKQWMDELLERHPEAKAETWDVPDHENGHLAWVKFSEEIMGGVELPACVSDYVANPTAENRKCAEEWLNQNKNIELALMEIAALRQRSMGDGRMDGLATPGVRNIHKAFYIPLARGLIAAEDGNESLALAAFASAMSLVRHVDGIEASSLLGRIIATSARTVIYENFLNRIFPTIGADTERLSAWRNTLSPDDTRDGLTRALIGENLRCSALLISSALSGEFDSITEFEVSEAETKVLIDAEFELKARVIAAVKSGSSLESIPFIHGQLTDTNGLSDISLDYLAGQVETMQSAVAGILKKETRLMMHDAALAAAIGETIPVDPVSGKPFLWDEITMTLSAPEGTNPQKPVTLPTRK
jgi:hypothetical protein